MSLIENLKQRKLVEWALAYLAGAWVVVQAMEALSEPLGLSVGFQRGLLLLLAAGLPVAMTLAWYHGEKGRQRVSGMELLILTFLLAATGVLLGIVAPRGDAGADSQSAAQLPPLASDGLPVLAILPFDNRSQLAGDQDLTDGIHDQVLTELSKRGDVRLLSRTSVQEYRDTKKGIPEIATELGASHLVEGAVQRAGGEVLVTTQLIDAKDQHLWSNDYQRELTVANLFDIQREVAGRVARELGLRLTAADEEEGIPTESPEAWEAYQQARLLHLTDPMRLTLAQEAVELDSLFVEAWAELATAHSAQALEVIRLQSRPLARQALHRARELDPDNVAVLEAEFYVAYGVEMDLRRALEVADELLQRRPNSPEVLRYVARVQERLGQWDEAFATYQRSLEHDPRSYATLHFAGHLSEGLGRFDEAERYFERAAYVARTDGDRNRVRRDLANIHISQRADTAAALRVSEALGLESEPVGCSWSSFAYLRRQFERALEKCLAGGGGPIAHFSIARLADWVGASTTREIYADSIRRWADSRIAYMNSLEHGRFRWPLSTGTASLAWYHALEGDTAATSDAADRAMEVFAPKNDVRDMGRLARHLIEPYIMIGDHEAALDMIEIAARAAPSVSVQINPGRLRLDPAYDPLRNHSRFRDILREMEEPR